jgi:hypothetical protein
MNLDVFDHVFQLPLLIQWQSTKQALSMQMQSGHDSSVGYTVSKNCIIFVGYSAFGKFAHAVTTPHGAQIVSTQ